MGPILEVRNISKQFPGVKALDDVSMAFYPGEVHAIVGENGAGKSTLMKILVGAYAPDSGSILFNRRGAATGSQSANGDGAVNGDRVLNDGELAEVIFNHPREAQEMGISIIYQEFNLLPERTVAQNIFLGREPTRRGMVDQRALQRQTVKVLEQLDAQEMISPDAEVKTLSVAEQQLVEIAKAISLDARVLIMDEPTAALAADEVAMLTKLIGKLKARGLAVIFISHRFREVFDIAKRITVLKDGQKVGEVAAKEATPAQVIKMMVGRDLSQYFPGLAKPEEIGEVVVSVEAAGNDKLHDINLTLRAGEIVGLAGLQGSGRTELARALFGVEPFTSGVVRVNGEVLQIKAPATAIRHGMGFVTEDRKAEGVLPNQPVRDNVLVTVRALHSLLLRIRRNGTSRRPNLVPELVEQVGVRTPSYEQEVQYLSGGNQQKVVLAKWLASRTGVLIFDEPTRGIDVDAKASIHDMIRDLARKGSAILMISSELPEVIGMSDRIVVMWDGTIAGELAAESREDEIMVLATGHG